MAKKSPAKKKKQKTAALNSVISKPKMKRKKNGKA